MKYLTLFLLFFTASSASASSRRDAVEKHDFAFYEGHCAEEPDYVVCMERVRALCGTASVTDLNGPECRAEVERWLADYARLIGGTPTPPVRTASSAPVEPEPAPVVPVVRTRVLTPAPEPQPIQAQAELPPAPVALRPSQIAAAQVPARGGSFTPTAGGVDTQDASVTVVGRPRSGIVYAFNPLGAAWETCGSCVKITYANRYVGQYAFKVNGVDAPVVYRGVAGGEHLVLDTGSSDTPAFYIVGRPNEDLGVSWTHYTQDPTTPEVRLVSGRTNQKLFGYNPQLPRNSPRTVTIDFK